MTYQFFPIPGTRYHQQTLRNRDQKTGLIVETQVQIPEESTSVCNVDNQEHVDHLLKLSMYEPYDAVKVEEERRAEEAKNRNPVTGYGIEKYADKGYVAVCKKKKPYTYAGESMAWGGKDQITAPFKSEMEAYGFIKSEAEESSIEDDDDELSNLVDKVANKKRG
jgi:hypothetical protein